METGRPLFIPVILGTARMGRMSLHAARLVTGELSKCAGVETDLIDIAKLPLPTNDAGEAIKQADFSAKMGMRRIGYTTNTKPRPGHEPRARNTSIKKLHGPKEQRMKHSRLK